MNYEKETLKHIENVRKFIYLIMTQLERRARDHDYTKLQNPEKDFFKKYTPKLKTSTYGSDEYKQFLKEMKPALDHHYAKSRHHPEHFKNHYKDGNWNPLSAMNLVDLIEMVCDWKAATLRHDDGDIYKSIEINQKRFNISDQVCDLIRNTVMLFESASE